MKQKTLTKQIQFFMMVGILALLAFTPLGFLTIPPISITFLHIPVIIGALLLGFKYGIALGGIFGIFSILKSSFSAVSPLDLLFSPILSGNPLGSLWLSLGTRLVFGGIICALFYMAEKKGPMTKIKVGLIAGISTLAHSILVLGSLSFIFDYLLFKEVFLIALGLNGILEILSAIILTMSLYTPLYKLQKR